MRIFLRMKQAMKSKILVQMVVLFAMCGGLVAGTARAQNYSAGVDTAVVSKYIWRGQLLTNDWSFQPSVTVGAGGFSFNAWGSMDLTAVNPADNITIPEDPLANPGDDDQGLKGQFSEIDYTFSYDHALENVSFGTGVIFYTFPQRSSTLATTSEIYGTVSFDSVPGAPSATIYIDVDETSAGDGDPGLYFLLGAGHSFATGNDVFTGLDLSGSIAFANNGFGNFYYGLDQGGAHDVSLTLSAPVAINDNWSFSGFVTYSALLGDYRDYQFTDPRTDFLGTSGTPRSFADTVWGGFTLSVGF